MIENRSAGYKRKKRRYNLLTSDGPFPGHHNILQFYAGGGRGEVLEQLNRHLQNCDEPVVVRGEPGSGKTLLSLVLAERLKKKFLVCRYDFPTVSRSALLRFVIGRINPLQCDSKPEAMQSGTVLPTLNFSGGVIQAGAEQHEDASMADLMSAIQQAEDLVQPVLLIIDNNAEPDPELVALLAELSEIRLNGCALFNIVLFLSESYTSETEQVASRAAIWHDSPGDASSAQYALPYKSWKLRRLSLAEIHDYLEHHMTLFDYSQRTMFSREMSYFIADRTEGVYGRINELARSAFLLAGINNSSQVSLSHLIAVNAPQRVRAKHAGGLRYVTRGGVRFAMLVLGIVVLGTALVLMSAN